MDPKETGALFTWGGRLYLSMPQNLLFQLLHCTGAKLAGPNGVDDALALSKKLAGLLELMRFSARPSKNAC
jgi:hypothetical protein